MKKNTLFALSIQREIVDRRVPIESEIDKCMNRLGFKSLLHQCGIRKQKGFLPISLLFALVLLPLLRQRAAGLWAQGFFNHFVSAQKDTFYRFLNCPKYNWRKFLFLLVNRILAKWDSSSFNERVLIADDTLLPKTGKNMELVSYHHDHTTHRSQLGYQWLQLGYHNGRFFFPIDGGFHTSRKRPNRRVATVDRRTCGWKRRQESFEKKTDLLEQMLRRAEKAGISARFLLFDSWFANDDLIAKSLRIGYAVICRLKANQTRYGYNGKMMNLKELWHHVARHQLEKVPGWQMRATALHLELPKTGRVRVVFTRCSKKRWHCFLCTETDLDIAEILKYYSRRWVIEVYFKDCKQLLDLGRGQSESFDALVALTTIIMIRYLLLVYLLLKKHTSKSIGPIFRQLAEEQLEAAVLSTLWERLTQIIMLSSQLIFDDVDNEKLFQLLEFIEMNILQFDSAASAKL
jgi:hypothetical protein